MISKIITLTLCIINFSGVSQDTKDNDSTKSFFAIQNEIDSFISTKEPTYPKVVSKEINILKSESIQLKNTIDSGITTIKNQALNRDTSFSLLSWGNEFRSKLEDYKTIITTNFPTKDSIINTYIPVEDVVSFNKVMKWEERYFIHNPLAGIIAFLSNIKTNIQLLEIELIQNK